MKYPPDQIATASKITAGNIWVADETVLKLDKDINGWFFDIIDDDTRFLLASHMSLNRTTKDAQTLMEKALERAGKMPKIVYTDRLRAYLDGIELTFGAYTEHRQGGPFDIQNNTNKIERFHSTLKSRTEIMRGMHNKQTAVLIMDGWLINYNYFRPHESLGNKTPAVAAKSDYPYKNWNDVVTVNSLKVESCVST
jgi:transposase-like protein